MKNFVALSALAIAVSAVPVSYDSEPMSYLGYAHTTAAAAAAPTGASGLMSSFEDELKAFMSWWDQKQGGGDDDSTRRPSAHASAGGDRVPTGAMQNPTRPTDLYSSPVPRIITTGAVPTGAGPTGVAAAPTILTTAEPTPSAPTYSTDTPGSSTNETTGVETSGDNAAAAGTSNYKQFKGDGSTGAGWPAMSAWVSSYDSMWTLQQTNMAHSCSNIFAQAKVADNSAAEMTNLKAAIKSVGSAASVDPRFVLAVVMQETGGCVRAWGTTSPDGTVFNPGLMQDHNGAHTCNSGKYSWSSSSYTPGTVQNPCPTSELTGMIQDGVDGTASQPGGGDGLKQTIAQAVSKYHTKDAQSYYVGARIYNSGSYDGSHLGGAGATPCYASDIANRLIGWNGPESKCTSATAN